MHLIDEETETQKDEKTKQYKTKNTARKGQGGPGFTGRFSTQYRLGGWECVRDVKKARGKNKQTTTTKQCYSGEQLNVFCVFGYTSLAYMLVTNFSLVPVLNNQPTSIQANIEIT